MHIYNLYDMNKLLTKYKYTIQVNFVAPKKLLKIVL